MISGGAAFTFSLLALIAGIAIGMTLRPATRHRTRVGREWGENDQAALTERGAPLLAALAALDEADDDWRLPDARLRTAAAEIGSARAMTLGEAQRVVRRMGGARVELESGLEVQLAAPYDQDPEPACTCGYTATPTQHRFFCPWRQWWLTRQDLAARLSRERALALHALERMPDAVRREALRLERETALTLREAIQRAQRQQERARRSRQ